jgi:flagellar protein FlgJ
MPRLNQLASIIEDVTPGASARARVAIRNATGISIGEDMDDLQVFDALINQLVPQQRPPGSGTMSDADLALFKNSLPSLIGTKEGNRAIIETMIAINEYDIEAGKIARRALIDPNYTDEMAFADQDALYEQMNPLGTFENAVGDSDLFGGF